MLGTVEVHGRSGVYPRAVPLSTDSVGATGAAVETPIDARWTMAYAAALGETSPNFLDTHDRPDVLAHPLFPVCFEWPVLLGVFGGELTSGMTPDERVRGVHYSHDLVVHRPIRAASRLTTRASIVAIERHRAGAYQVVRLDTTAEDGAPVCTTRYGSLYRGVEVVGEDRRSEALAQVKRIDAEPHRIVEVPVAANAAHVYTECARIWNPIHTDAAVAQGAGLPGIILHGTATLAMAVSALVAAEWCGDFERVGRVTGRFGAMVAPPSTLQVRILMAGAGEIFFDVRNDRGEPAIRDGRLEAVRES